MRKLLLVAFLPLALSACVTSSGSSSQLSQITTNVGVAIQSAQVLVQQAQAIPALAGNAKVAAQIAKISGYLATGANDINTVNTLAAALLTLAGAAGVTLPGL